jgi:hypothetical protein
MSSFPSIPSAFAIFNELVLPDGQALAYFYYEDEPGR